MRKHFLLRIVTASGLLVIAAVLIGNLFPDQVYALLEWGREWARIVTTRNNYALLADNDPSLRFDGDALAPPFMLRKSSAPVRPYSDEESYRVYEAWLSAVLGGSNVRVRHDLASPMEPIGRCFTAEARKTLASALNDFEAVNAENWRLNVRAFRNRRTVADSRGHEALRAEVSFSAVGFNENRSVAVMYAAFWCGPLCGRGTYYALEKHDGEWMNVQGLRYCGWIS